MSRAGTRSIIWISYLEDATEDGSNAVLHRTPYGGVETGNWDFGVHGSWLDAVKQFLPSTVNLEPGLKKGEFFGRRMDFVKEMCRTILALKHRMELSMVSPELEFT